MQWVFAALFLVVQASPAEAQGSSEPIEAWQDSTYPGVIPGTDHRPPRVTPTGRGARARLVTWPGFQSRPDGASRFFVQTSGPVEVEERSEPHRFVVVLKNTRPGLRNNLRPLETRHFATPVARAQVIARRRDAEFVLELKEDVTPSVRTVQGEDGYFFVFVEFPPSTSPAPRTATRPTEETVDTERPPALRGSKRRRR